MREKSQIKQKDLVDYIKICIKCGKLSNKTEKMNLINCHIEKQEKKAPEKTGNVRCWKSWTDPEMQWKHL